MEQALESFVSLFSAVTDKELLESTQHFKRILAQSYLSQHGGEEEPTVEVLARWLLTQSIDLPAEPSLSAEATVKDAKAFSDGTDGLEAICQAQLDVQVHQQSDGVSSTELKQFSEKK